MGISIIEVNLANPHWEITEFYNVIIKLNSLETEKNPLWIFGHHVGKSQNSTQ